MLWPEYKALPGVTVTESPVRMNGDTISFKAKAFNAKPDATVEDVLKKIPGVQVQKDGSVKAMGEQVQKIYVDGKEFFGNDPHNSPRVYLNNGHGEFIRKQDAFSNIFMTASCIEPNDINGDGFVDLHF